MLYKILLSRFDDTKAAEAQEQSRFLKSILEALEVPIDFDPDEPLSIEKKQKLREDFKSFNLHVLTEVDGGMRIFVGDDLIAEWFKSTYKLKQDLSQRNRQDRLYLEMTVNFWSIFEEEDAGEEEKESTMQR